MRGLVSAAAAAASAALLCRDARAQAAVCNVEDSAVTILDHTSFAGVDTHTIVPASVLGDGRIKVAQLETTGGTSSQVWLAQQERVTDGFIATFQFNISGTGDGLAFVVQNDKTVDTAGGTQLNLGFRDGLDKYLGVGFESCSNFADPCAGQRVVIYEMGQAALGDTPVEVGSGAPVRDIADGALVNARVVYTQDDLRVKVFVDDALVAQGVLGQSLEDNFGSRFGWFGFSASTTGHPTPFFLTADTTVSNLRLQVQPSDVAIGSKVGETVDWGRTYIFELTKRDSCQQSIAFVNNITILANLTNVDSVARNNVTRPQDLVEGRDIFYPVITANSAGGYSLRFDLPFRVAASWRLAVDVDGVAAAGSPIDNAVVTQEPAPPSGLPTWGLIVLICIISCIVLGTVYGIVRLRRYRRKLKENEENIEAGKEKFKLDVLDRDVSYNINPMLGTLEEMRAKLAENEKTLERLRAGKAGDLDDARSVEELNRQNKQLRDEMNKLKKEAQQDDALTSNFSGDVDAGPKSDKKQFGQARA